MTVATSISSPMSILPWIVLALVEALAQVSLKLAADAAGVQPDAWTSLVSLMHQPWFAVSIACDAAGFVAWMLILARHELSVAVPVSALCYFAILAASAVFLSEPAGWRHAAGLLMIGGGILCISRDP